MTSGEGIDLRSSERWPMTGVVRSRSGMSLTDFCTRCSPFLPLPLPLPPFEFEVLEPLEPSRFDRSLLELDPPEPSRVARGLAGGREADAANANETDPEVEGASVAGCIPVDPVEP